MRIAINHETVCRYHPGASYSIQYLRLTPLTSPAQQVLAWRLSGPGQMKEWVDAFGNHAHVLVVDGPHQEIRISAIGEIDLADDDEAPLPSDGEPHPPELFLRGSRLTEADATVLSFAYLFRNAFRSGQQAGLEALRQGIGDRIAYHPGNGMAVASAREVLERGNGGSQDFAHLFVACARALGVPARYVSGYLCAAAGEDATPLVSHAWAEAWVDGVGWLRYDAPDAATGGRRHIRLAVGLDHLDAAPVQGVRRQGGPEIRDIQVEIAGSGRSQRLDVQAQQQQQQ